ncbi:AsnC family transcriptional regulator [Amycolatopsis sp. MEPSY49]|uniref:AsnC family transcriptional regulator n=1 Tax=Amycolatopsis sp. MEPSY49 TaxID=3151600 RepID=UPI003EF628A5
MHLDRQIVDQLVVNGRASLTDIARVVALSVPAVKRRISRLERDDAIRIFESQPEVLPARCS